GGPPPPSGGPPPPSGGPPPPSGGPPPPSGGVMSIEDLKKGLISEVESEKNKENNFLAQSIYQTLKIHIDDFEAKKEVYTAIRSGIKRKLIVTGRDSSVVAGIYE